MKKIVYLIPVSMIVFACSGEEGTDTNRGDIYTEDSGSMDEVLQIGDQLFVDSMLAESGIQTYETIEDYIQIKSKTDLYNLFSENDLEDGESWYGEGSMRYDNSWLTNPKNGQKVKYVWDQETSNELVFIEFQYTLYNESFEAEGT
jgi:signal peptidase I